MNSRAATRAPARELPQTTALLRALAARDELRVEAACAELFDFDPRSLSESLDDESLLVRRAIHEVLDDALRGFLLADDFEGEAWRRLLLPAPAGVFTRPIWIANAHWLRDCGSQVPENNDESLDAARLSELGLKGQAKALGRYCLSNDGARGVDVSAVFAALDTRLAPLFTTWLVGTHSLSPGRFHSAEASEHQRLALEQLLEHWRGRRFDLPASSIELETTYDVAYREHVDLPAFTRLVNGGAMTSLFTRLQSAAASDGSPLNDLGRGAHVLVAPNWREDHVSHRCLSPLLEGERERGTTALLIREHAGKRRGSPAEGWKAIEHELPGTTHHLIELGDVTRQLASRGLEFAFFPEITPSNTSAWIATQRVARVQATGYGYPVTSGLDSMDFFVCGTEIEDVASAARYNEQVVLIPGFGVSTTTPPIPDTARTRPLEDESLQLVSAAGFRKLSPRMLEAWNQILRTRPNTALDLYPAMTDVAAARQGPRLAQHLSHDEVTLHASVPRLELLEKLSDADLYLDSYPFGGFNTLIEVLACGCPFVTLEGDDARNRFGAAILRRLELPEFLIARDWSEYISAASRILADLGLRRELRARLTDRDAVLRALADPDASAHFDAAVEWMLQRGPRAGERAEAPVIIEAGSTPRAMVS